MKKIYSAIILMAMLTSVNTAVNADDTIKVVLNNEEIVFDVAPEIINGRTMVPMRKFFEGLGAEVSWNDETKTAIGTKKLIEVEFTMDEEEYRVCGIPFESEAAVYLKDGRTMISVRAVAESMGADVIWNGDTREVIITDKKMDYQENEDYKLYAESKGFECNGFGVKVYNSGEIYVGNFKGGKYDGSGAMKFDNGYYIGEYADDYRNGYGKYVWYDGGCYIGNWSKNKREGNGTYYRDNGEYYNAEYVNDKLHGDIEYHYLNGDYLVTTNNNLSGELKGNSIYYDKNGSYRKSDGGSWTMKTTVFHNSDGSLKDGIDTFRIQEQKAIYKGEFSNGRINGKGELICDNGSHYKGEYKDGALNGNVTISWSNGCSYEGVMKNDNYTKNGRFKDDSGDYYVVVDDEKAAWINNYIFYNADGTPKNGKTRARLCTMDVVVEADFVNGRPHGKGEFYKNGKIVYSGDFTDGAITGYGEIYFDDGTYYAGEVYDGVREGKGTMHYSESEGDYYFGQWKNDKKFGEGTYYFEDGTKSIRKYGENEELIYSEGRVEYTNGNVFIGNIIDGKMQGKGKMIFSDGNVYDGYFKDGLRQGKANFYFDDKSYIYSDWDDDKCILNEESYFYNSDNKLLNSEKYGVILNGITYMGRIENGRFNGECSVTEDGTEQKVFMRDNEIVDVIPEYKNLKYSDGDYFNGTVKDGKWYTGEGKWTGSDGQYFEGKWDEGYWYEGYGYVKYYNDGYFKGNWKYGKRYDGDIKISYSNGEYFSGTLREGYWYTGYGYCIYDTGNSYEGYYKDGYHHGECTYYQADTGRYWVGTCKYGEYVSGVWYNSDGTIYEENNSDNADVETEEKNDVEETE